MNKARDYNVVWPSWNSSVNTSGEPISSSCCRASSSLGSMFPLTSSQSAIREADRGAESSLFLLQTKIQFVYIHSCDGNGTCILLSNNNIHCMNHPECDFCCKVITHDWYRRLRIWLTDVSPLKLRCLHSVVAFSLGSFRGWRLYSF